MPRGGRREGAGRRSTWKSGCSFAETKLIRVPAYIADKVLEFAHKLDSGKPSDLETNSNDNSFIVTQPKPESEPEPRSDDSVVPGQLHLFSDLDFQPADPPALQPPKPLSGRKLAKRFTLSCSTVHEQRQKYSALAFLSWSAEKDPEGWSWEYDPETQKYYPVLLEF